MKRILDRFLNILGYVIVKKETLSANLKNDKYEKYDLANARGKINLGLENILLKNNQFKWLEIGTGGRTDNGFDYIDIIEFPIGKVPKNYKRLDIVKCTDQEIDDLGKYDFIRMQHVFEHFAPEDGLIVLKNCSKILNPGGVLLISCPDIDKGIEHYRNGTIKQLNGDWGTERFGSDAPDSFYFSIFTHSVLHEPHLWCYNAEGIGYQLKRTNEFDNIEVIDLDNYKSAIPFTHNRPHTDVTVIANKKREEN